MKILFAVSEAAPFAASGGLADVAGSLPRALRHRQQTCRVVMPLYDIIAETYREKMEFVAEFSVQLSWRRQICTVYRFTEGGVIYYFLDNPYYFRRGRLYGEYDDGERFAFFSKAVLDMLEPIGFLPDVIHCNDWQTALIPTYLNLFYREQAAYKDIKTVFTIHNVQFQGKYGLELVEDVLGIAPCLQGAVEYDGCCNLMKGAIEQADLVTTVSPTYAVELMDPWFSYGMDRLLRQNRYKLSGITNGIDQKLYNPASDPMIYAAYSSLDLAGKKICKRELQKTMGIEQNQNPIIAMVTRLTYQKGLDLVKYIFDDLMSLPVSFVLLASGDWDYEQFFNEMQGRYPGRVGVRIGFDAELSHKIYAGSDMFLMPSATEPCGLAQMIALRYGTLPIVRRTGGLKDTVTDVGDGGTGYTFATYNAHDMLWGVQRAIEDYQKPVIWEALVKKALDQDFGWGCAASAYVALYQKLAK
ncbi:MAG: glycogen synthase GlgA [Oscillospiraceae bacterium]